MRQQQSPRQRHHWRHPAEPFSHHRLEAYPISIRATLFVLLSTQPGHSPPPSGHTQCHRVAHAHRKQLLGRRFEASSPNGRFQVLCCSLPPGAAAKAVCSYSRCWGGGLGPLRPTAGLRCRAGAGAKLPPEAAGPPPPLPSAPTPPCLAGWRGCHHWPPPVSH